MIDNFQYQIFSYFFTLFKFLQLLISFNLDLIRINYSLFPHYCRMIIYFDFRKKYLYFYLFIIIYLNDDLVLLHLLKNLFHFHYLNLPLHFWNIMNLMNEMTVNILIYGNYFKIHKFVQFQMQNLSQIINLINSHNFCQLSFYY